MIKEVFERNGISLSEKQNEGLNLFAEILTEYNKKINLTAITDEEDVAIKHFLDSVKGLKFIKGKEKIIDIGSGAGFPSIPVIIMNEDKNTKFVLMDSLKKRVDFLNYVIEELKLENVTAVHRRAEEEAKINRERYDAVLARAVAPLNVLAEYALPLLKIGGQLVAYKGKAEEEEAEAVRAIKVLGGTKETTEKYLLDGKYERSFVIVKKTSKTPEKYPRGQNKPRLMPL